MATRPRWWPTIRSGSLRPTAPDGAYDVAVRLPDLAPGTYIAHVALMSDSSGSSEVGHATFTVGETRPAGPAEDHVVFVTEPVVAGSTLSYRAARLDGRPIAAGSGVDIWSIDGLTRPRSWPTIRSRSLRPTRPDGAYDVAVQLPDLAPGTYIAHVALMSDSSGSSEVGHATFTV